MHVSNPGLDEFMRVSNPDLKRMNYVLKMMNSALKMMMCLQMSTRTCKFRDYVVRVSHPNPFLRSKHLQSA